MALRSTGRKLSFEILSRNGALEEDDSLLRRSKSDSIENYHQQTRRSLSPDKPNRKKRKHKTSRKKKIIEPSIPEDPTAERTADSNSVSADSRDPHLSPVKTEVLLENGGTCDANRYDVNCLVAVGTVVCEEITAPEESKTSVCTLAQVPETDFQIVHGAEGFNFRELRQRTVNGGSNEDLSASVIDDNGKGDSIAKTNSAEKQRSPPNENVVRKLEPAESLDWKRLMAEDPNSQLMLLLIYASSSEYITFGKITAGWFNVLTGDVIGGLVAVGINLRRLFALEKSPVKYFLEEMYNGNALGSTTTLGNEKERERVYDTIFRLPWRCELLIGVGFFVCFDSFLSLLTVMPTRIAMTIWRLLKSRQFKRLSTMELSDFGCFLIMGCGVTLLQRTDISLIYHMIRGQGTIKLYVVYNVLEIFDKLCQSFGGDVLQTLFHSAEGLANSPPETMRFWIWRFVSDLALAVAASIIHSFILLAQAITLSTCIVAHNNALLALLVSNNFAEIKSNVFKRYSRDNVHSLVYFDSVERFHISAFILFVLAQNILEAEGPWFEGFLINILLVYVCEMVIDIIKHSFIAKFNDIKPIAYSEFLEDLCKQTLNMHTEGTKKNLTFVPLAPACVVIRVLTPVYAAHLPYNPLPWRLFWIVLFTAMTYVMLTSLKVLIGMGLQKHATWYVNRCRRRKQHLHAD